MHYEELISKFNNKTKNTLRIIKKGKKITTVKMILNT